MGLQVIRVVLLALAGLAHVPEHGLTLGWSGRAPTGMLATLLCFRYFLYSSRLAQACCHGKEEVQRQAETQSTFSSLCIHQVCQLLIGQTRHLAKPRGWVGGFWKVTELSMDTQGASSQVITASIYQRKEVKLTKYTLNCSLTGIPALMELPDLC